MQVSSIRMRKLLGQPVSAPVLPEGSAFTPFIPEQHAEAVHRLLDAAYARGGGEVAPFADWWKQLEGDSEYDPSLVFLAIGQDGSLVGAAQCWTSAFIKDLGVADGWRRRGIGTALLQQAFNVFALRGATSVELKVLADNPSGAERLYRILGMTQVKV